MARHARCILAALTLTAACGGALAAGDDGPTLLGAAIRNRPSYEGASHRETDAVPLLRVYRGAGFLRTTQGMLEGGVRLGLADGLVAGAQFAYEAGPLDGDAGGSAGAHLEWDTQLGRAPLNALLRFRQHLDSDHGRELDARATLGVFQAGTLTAGVFGQATWGDARHQRAYYGVDEGGVWYASLGVLGSWDIAPSWVMLGSAELRVLTDDLADSPVAEQRGAAFASAGVAYRF